MGISQWMISQNGQPKAISLKAVSLKAVSLKAISQKTASICTRSPERLPINNGDGFQGAMTAQRLTPSRKQHTILMKQVSLTILGTLSNPCVSKLK
ncbi:MAG: hypothetical protein AAFR58_05155 [Cyanobacteria bacterium J06627_28]